MEALIREARPDDFEAVFALVLELREHFGSGEPVDKGGVLAIFARYLDGEDHYIYVAETDGSVVALMDMTIRLSLYDHRPYAFIDELVVNAECRGRGIGKLLVDRAFSHAVERGCSEVSVDTTATNETALAFYRSYGFDREGIMLEKELD